MFTKELARQAYATHQRLVNKLWDQNLTIEQNDRIKQLINKAGLRYQRRYDGYCATQVGGGGDGQSAQV
jgi:hypothetical protein